MKKIIIALLVLILGSSMALIFISVNNLILNCREVTQIKNYPNEYKTYPQKIVGEYSKDELTFLNEELLPVFQNKKESLILFLDGLKCNDKILVKLMFRFQFPIGKDYQDTRIQSLLDEFNKQSFYDLKKSYCEDTDILCKDKYTFRMGYKKYFIEIGDSGVYSIYQCWYKTECKNEINGIF